MQRLSAQPWNLLPLFLFFILYHVLQKSLLRSNSSLTGLYISFASLDLAWTGNRQTELNVIVLVTGHNCYLYYQNCVQGLLLILPTLGILCLQWLYHGKYWRKRHVWSRDRWNWMTPESVFVEKMIDGTTEMYPPFFDHRCYSFSMIIIGEC